MGREERTIFLSDYEAACRNQARAERERDAAQARVAQLEGALREIRDNRDTCDLSPCSHIAAAALAATAEGEGNE